MRQTKLGTNCSHLVLKQCAQRFNQFKLQVFWKTSNVVVRLDARCCTTTGFNNIWVQGSLDQELDRARISGRFGD